MPVLCTSLLAEEPEKLLFLPVFTPILSTGHKSIQLDLFSANEYFPTLLAWYHANIQTCEWFCLFSLFPMKAELTWSLGQQMSHGSSRNYFWSHCQLCGWTPQPVSFHKNALQKSCEKTWVVLEKCVQNWQIIWLYITHKISPTEHRLGQSTELWEKDLLLKSLFLESWLLSFMFWYCVFSHKGWLSSCLTKYDSSDISTDPIKVFSRGFKERWRDKDVVMLRSGKHEKNR